MADAALLKTASPSHPAGALQCDTRYVIKTTMIGLSQNNPLFTIGYEGASIGAFIATLHDLRITDLLDVRALPISRKRGFSKTALTEALMHAGIRYVPLKGLGDPKPGRDAMRQGKYALFHSIYLAHLATDVAQRALQQAVAVAKAGRAILLCFERDPKCCHRTIVAEHMRRVAGFRIHNLGVDNCPYRAKQGGPALGKPQDFYRHHRLLERPPPYH